MLIIDTRDADSIEKALKKYKKKFDQAGIVKQLRSRTAFIKKSVAKRNKVSKAAYTQAYIKNLEA
jgi:small subunit ribosomal protein S21